MRDRIIALLIVASSLAVPSAPIFAAGKPTGAVVAATDFGWRGLSLHDGDPGLSVSYFPWGGKGTYLGVFATTVEFKGGPGTDPGLELQADVGRCFALGRAEASLGIIQSWYPNAGALRYSEPYLMLARGPASLTCAYAPRYFGSQSRSLHLYGKRTFSLPRRLDLCLGLGTFRMTDNASAGLADWVYWTGSLERPIRRGALVLSYANTNPNEVGFSTIRWTFGIRRNLP